MTLPAKPSQSLGRRALYALLLMVGFYVLALGVVGVLLYLPYAEWQYVGRIEIRLALFCAAAAFAILAAVAPSIDKFEPPGPVLQPGDHPRLFQLIKEIAAATRQAPPRQVYLVPEPNAWVAQRGGIMGFGSERVMGVGLPLLQTLTIPEFSAVLAHEFGHFHGGDTMLGPWIYKTRSAIGRTLAAFSEQHTWLGKPFEWYGNLFLRITHAVSRQQEYAADALAAKVVGAAPLATGLQSIHVYAPLFPSFWHNEVAPALRAGYRPPIAAGFHDFLRSPGVATAAGAMLEQQLAGAGADPLDTHPPLSDRLAALEVRAHALPSLPAEPATLLLGQPEALEERLLAHLLPTDVSAGLKPAQWADMGELVFLPTWREVVAGNSSRLAGLRTDDLASLSNPPGALAVRFKLAATPAVATERGIAEARYLVGASLALALHRRGFQFTALPGEPIAFDVAGSSIRPFEVMGALCDGSLAPESWARLLEESHLHGQPLLEVPPA